jgi:hypothetical protein
MLSKLATFVPASITLIDTQPRSADAFSMYAINCHLVYLKINSISSSYSTRFYRFFSVPNKCFRFDTWRVAEITTLSIAKLN